MATEHAQRVARARRLYTVRALAARALLAYVNKDLWDRALSLDDERLPWDDAPTAFRPEDWRLEGGAVAEDRDAFDDEIPEYEGSDLDGMFL
jgi:hypothetical protein